MARCPAARPNPESLIPQRTTGFVHTRLRERPSLLGEMRLSPRVLQASSTNVHTSHCPLDPNGQGHHNGDMTYLDCDLEPAPSTVTEEGVELPHAGREPRDRPRVLVADPDQLARRALTDSLRADGGFAVIGQASDGVEVVELARHYRPDIVLIATTLPRLGAGSAWA